MNDQHSAEAEERWGETEAFQESTRRTASYTAADWAAIKAEADAIYSDFAAAMAEGAEPGSTRAKGLAERHRSHISKWFYDCPPAMHAGLGQLYASDARFTETIDATIEGLSQYLAAAFAANSSG